MGCAAVYERLVSILVHAPAALRTLTSSNSGLLDHRPSLNLLWLAHGKPVWVYQNGS